MSGQVLTYKMNQRGLKREGRLDRAILLVVSLKNKTLKIWLAPSQKKGAWAWPSALVSTKQLLLLVQV